MQNAKIKLIYKSKCFSNSTKPTKPPSQNEEVALEFGAISNTRSQVPSHIKE